MEATVLSLGKCVVNGALSYAKSAAAGEAASRLGVRRDQAFIADELEMMQAFLLAAHDERRPGDGGVVRVWVKQVRDVAYDVEDSLQDLAVRLQKQPWWRTLLDRRLVGGQMRELRAKVEDVSRRNKRYRLVNGDASVSKPGTASTGEFPIAGVTMSCTDEARRQWDKAKMDLLRLVNSNKDDDLRVIALWGENGETSILRKAYEDLKMHNKFECSAWVKLARPVHPTECLQSILRQFYVNSLQQTTMEAQDLRWMEMTNENDLADEFKRFVDSKRYLVVLKGVHTIEEWDSVKVFLSNNKKGSRIIVSTEQVEVASLCVRQRSAAAEHKQLHMDHALYAFYEKGSEDRADATDAGSSFNATITSINSSAESKSLTHTETSVASFKEYEIIGREKEKCDIIKLISNDSQQLEVISVWGMGGLGKTTLVRDVYQSEQLNVKFRCHACVTIMHPFDCGELIKSLARQLDAEDYENKEETGLTGGRTKPRVQRSLVDILEGKKYLIVLDDLSSATEWDSVIQHLPARETASRIIVTTRSENIARHCSKKHENIYKLQILGYEDGLNLFTEKVFQKITYLTDEHPELVEQANLILKKCDGLPLAIVTIGGFLANQPKTALEWTKLNDHISAELEMNPELGRIAAVLNKSYDGLPYRLKSCMFYFSIFPQDSKVSRRRLVCRWTAEGYSREVRGKSAEEIAESYFMELISRSMILPSQESIHSRIGVDSCQVHDLIREIGISKSMEDNLVFTLEDGCGLNNRVTIRHLAISSSWEGDQCEFKSIVDMSHIRSLTVFGKWRPFFMSEKMRLLRVLDLEGTSGLVDHHLTDIGKLLHLRYLSLRGCDDIYHLPDSLGNLRQLQTLDVMYTSIIKLPRSIIKLSKLRHIRAGGIGSNDGGTHETYADTLCILTLSSMAYCVACCAPQVLKEVMDMDGDPNRRDVCTGCCCNKLPSAATRQSPNGVQVPTGIRRLKALDTMGVVNVSGSGGKAALSDIKRLTRLRKLRVTGINKKNSQELCSALSELSCLESLLVRSEGSPGLSGCLDDLSSPPKKLQSLKLYGNLVKLPEWAERLRNLVKMELRSSRILDVDATLHALGNLPNLAILRLLRHAFAGQKLRFNFDRKTAFLGLVVLELSLLDDLESVEFQGGAAPKIELLQFRGWRYRTNIVLFAGLPSLLSLKEVLLKGRYEDVFVDDLRTQLSGNPNRPVLKGSEDRADATDAGSSFNATITSINSSAESKSLTHTETSVASFKEYEIIGREKEKCDIIKLISNDSQQLEVISVWGMGGLGKTTLVRDVYQSEQLNVKFRCHACVTIMHPFDCGELIKSLARQLDAEDYENKEETGLTGGRTKPRVQRSLVDILEGKKYLIVLDDLSSATEWDSVIQHLPARETASRIIVTTRSENIARHCSKKHENIYKLQILGYEDGLNLFTEKVFQKITYLTDEHPELVEQANLILKKCDGLPLAIVTIGGFLANQPKTALEWTKLNDHISAELEMNPELGRIAAVLNKSYDGLPYRLKSCMFYFSIFPQDSKVSRRRLVCRWTAEGYSREVRGKSAEEIAESYFMELISRSMILPSQESIHSRIGVDSCQVHDLIREIGISKSMEDNLVFTLEDGCGLNNRVTIRHLAISSSWEGDQCEFKSIVDMSHIRSLTVFGKWRPFFMSEKMRLLRVLDLEGTSGLVDHHLTDIGKLLHLRYLSLRGCDDIYHLPDSLGNLRQLQTLDVMYTSIIKLPRSIIKLSKLRHIRAGGIGSNDGGTHETYADTLCILTLSSMAYCVACCAPQVLKEVMDMDGDPNRRDVCTGCCCNKLPSAATRQSPNGVQVPTGIRRLKALDTMGVVNVSGSGGKAALSDIKRLTRLRKLRVTGINKKNSQELCSALSELSCLESLLVRSEGSPGLSGCLDDLSSPPKKLQSLKLYGNLVKLPEWAERLRNLVKMELRSSRILDVDATLHALGNLPNLAILRLLRHAFAGQKLRFNFDRKTAFLGLVVLELSLLDDLESVEFQGGAAPKIELLQFRGWRYRTNIVLFAGLPSLLSLKEVLLKGRYEDVFVDDLRTQLSGNPNRPVLKVN